MHMDNWSALVLILFNILRYNINDSKKYIFQYFHCCENMYTVEWSI